MKKKFYGIVQPHWENSANCGFGFHELFSSLESAEYCLKERPVINNVKFVIVKIVVKDLPKYRGGRGVE